MDSAQAVAIAATFAAVIPATILAMASLVKANKLKDQSDRVEKKTDEIHVLVNSNLDAVKEKLKVAEAKIDKMEGFIADLIKERDSH